MKVQHILNTVAVPFVRANHYSRRCNPTSTCFGLYDGTELVGVCAFKTPCSENVRSSVFGEEHKTSVTELHRLCTLDHLPPNALSWFVARALKMLKARLPHIKAVIAYADSTEGHVGYIYQALNFVYCGETSCAWFYRDTQGSLRHPRNNGKNISWSQAREKGWTRERRSGKHRYVTFVGTKSERRWSKRNLLLPTLQYPKGGLCNTN